MINLNVSRYLVLITAFTLFILSGCGTPFEDAKRLSKAGDCDGAERVIRSQMGGAASYNALAANAMDCRRNQRMATEYLRQSARLGDEWSTSMLIQLGEKPPEPTRQAATVRSDAEVRKQACIEDATKRSGLCGLGCYGLFPNQRPACSSNCDQNYNIAKAACEGVYIQPSQPVIIQQQEPIVYPGIPSGSTFRPSTMNPFGR